jgi:hypothetical protein
MPCDGHYGKDFSTLSTGYSLSTPTWMPLFIYPRCTFPLTVCTFPYVPQLIQDCMWDACP